MEWSKWNGIEWNRTEGSGVEWHGAEPKGREQAVHGLQLKPQREKLYQASALRKQASFEKIKTILPNERSSAGSPFGQGQNMFLHIYQNDDKYLLLRMLSSTRDVSNPCTRGRSCLEYTTEKEKAKKKQLHKLESVSTQACEQTTRDKTFLVDERKIGSCHFPSKRRKIAGIFPQLVFYQN